MKTFILLICVICAIRGSVLAATRSSANYKIITETIDSAGARGQSSNYRNDASAGEITGISSVASPEEMVKHGYVAQLYDIIGLGLSMPPSDNLNETASRQLQAALLADDATTLTKLHPTAVAWSVVSGPVASISSSGLITAGGVYQDTPAAIRGAAQGLSGQLNFTVLNVNIDDYQTYASDGIDDAWQVQYFGVPPNLNAGPNTDPDGDGQTNLFEYIAGLVPTDPNSRFVLTIAQGPSVNSKNLIFNPLVAGRTYSVQFTNELPASGWNALTGTTQADAGAQRTVTDLNATEAQKFYHVRITKP
jgi:hypothetical protein